MIQPQGTEFERMVESATDDTPLVVTKDGKAVAMVVDPAWYERIKALVESSQAAARSEPTCICPRFKDTGGFRIADLTCPVHGVDGTEPGDGYWPGNTDKAVE